ncbi:MAG: peptidoglycan DD-metalloendopeptidase family protein [Lachnospiraceae bacterium]|nr:peptidoglycan DD-metalloendopeptidase family protein [Lachnospiraceae bacterium]
MKKRWILLGISLCMLFVSLWHPTVSATGNSALTSDSIKEKESQISKAEKEKESLKGNLSDLQKIKKELETKKNDLKSYVAELDGNLSEIEQKITGLKADIAVKEGEITQAEAELEAAQEKENNQKDSMISNIRLMYERGDPPLLDMLIRAESFGDFLNKADFVENIMAYDHAMWEEYIANRKLVELCKEQLELEKEILDQTKANVELEQQNLEALIAQKNQDITAYETDIDNKEQAIRDYEQLIAEQDAEIEALEKAIAEEKKALLAANAEVITYDGGLFKFPLASYTRMSDNYGWRMHPTLHVEQFHNGVDFAAPKGTAIYAAYDGKVVAATYSATMGNYVMIDHGSSLYTIYMHASALYVSKGDVVVRGETIAAVGTTGRSTGNHLHFGVRKDGEYVSPWNYLSE